ncbi:hypothetical protein KSF78_0004273 [Schistosoma japonicum]|nr:hypothetical protein KSF78_0004273 [Schistosoma japonicum]
MKEHFNPSLDFMITRGTCEKTVEEKQNNVLKSSTMQIVQGTIEQQSKINSSKLPEKSKTELLNRENAQNISTSQLNSLCKESDVKYRQYYIIQDKTNEKNHLKLYQRRGHKTLLNLLELRFAEKSSSDGTTNITEDNYDSVSAISSHSNRIYESSTDIDNCCDDHSKCIAPHTRIQERIFWDKMSTAQKPTELESHFCSKSESYQQNNSLNLENQRTHQVFPDMCNQSLERNCCQHDQPVHCCSISPVNKDKQYNSGEQSSGTNSCNCHMFHCAIHCNTRSPDVYNCKSNDSKGLQQHFNQLSLINQHICKHNTAKIITNDNLYSIRNPAYGNIPQKKKENHLDITNKNPSSSNLKVTKHCHCRCFQYINIDCQQHNSGTNRDKFNVKQQSPSYLTNQKNELNLNISNWCHNIKPSNQMCYSMNKCEKVTMTENMDCQNDLHFKRNYLKTKSPVVTGYNEHMHNNMHYNYIDKNSNLNIANLEGITISNSNKRHNNFQMNFLKNNEKF